VVACLGPLPRRRDTPRQHMKSTPAPPASQQPSKRTRALAEPRHLRCRRAVLHALRTTRPLPDDDDVKARLGPPSELDRRVVAARKAHGTAREALHRARDSFASEWALRGAESKLEAAGIELDQARGAARRALLEREMPQGVPESEHWPWRHGGPPWVWRCDLLLALPDWSHNACLEALQRLEAEGLVEGSGARPAKKAGAVRLTTRALQLDELVATLQASPAAAAVVIDALQADADGVR
jgi:hypothetical protein